jgi:hypothetical protein
MGLQDCNIKQRKITVVFINVIQNISLANAG